MYQSLCCNMIMHIVCIIQFAECTEVTANTKKPVSMVSALFQTHS